MPFQWILTKANGENKMAGVKGKSGRPKKPVVNQVSKVDNPFIDLGYTGLQRTFGTINEEFLLELKGLRGIKVYKEMRDNDDVVGAILFTIDMLLRGVKWQAEPEDETVPEDLEAAEFIETVVDDMKGTWTDFISEVLTMLPFGWSYFEKVFKLRTGEDGTYPSKHSDGLIGWHKLASRGQETLERWVFDDTGDLLGMKQQPNLGNLGAGGGGANAGAFLPIEKSFLFRTVIRKNNPEGRSVLRNAYRPWYFKKNIEQIEGIGIERDLAGLPVMYVPPEVLNAKPGTQEASLLEGLKKVIRNVRRDEQEGVIFPLVYDKLGNELYKFELMSTAGSRQFDTTKVKANYSRGIATTVLADFILIGHDKVGSFALASSKTKLFAVALGGWLDSIQETINRNGIDQLLRMNNMKGRCKLKHGDIETRDLKEIADYVQKLAASGALLPDDNLENKLRDLAGLPSLQAEGMETGKIRDGGESKEEGVNPDA